MRTAQRRDGGLGTESGVNLARSSSGQTVRGDPFLSRVDVINYVDYKNTLIIIECVDTSHL